jgi:protein-disulfide isomerase
MLLTRRNLVIGGGAAAGIAAIGGYYAMNRQPGPGAAIAQDGGDELMVAGPLGEMGMGDPDAPVTVIEYASMTCGHCATFHNQTWPRVKVEYVETGKVYFILREFPLDPLATAAFMLGRCLEGDRYFAFIDALFARQQAWAGASNPEQALFEMARQAGFNRENFNACLTNQEILDGVNWVKERGAQRFEVRSTPTFFINGEIVRGAISFSQFEEYVEPHLAV